MKILVIEDEPEMKGLIKQFLEDENYVVEVAGNFSSGLDKIVSYDYDCILLDITLPGGNGLDLIQELKNLNKADSVIIISAKDSIDDKVKGLDLGADDYLTKPFHITELNARIKSVIRRKKTDGKRLHTQVKEYEKINIITMKIKKTIGILIILMTCASMQSQNNIPLYRTFEKSLENNTDYSNKFIDVELRCTFISPSGKTIEFYGFYDGDGKGGGDSKKGNIWKFRFLPNEAGKWSYTWSWSDQTKGGADSFICDSDNAGKGILQAYKENPRWLAYNGTDPVWLKSYYESGHGSLAQPFDWITNNIYQPIIDRGYNHMQVNWLMSLCCFTQIYNDGPAPSTQDLTLYQEGKASSTMRFDVWKMMEQHVTWLNDRNIGLQMFLGFDGSKNEGPQWTSLSDTEKDFYVRYVVARLAPYANIASWNFLWEVPGNREDLELGWAKLVQKYDVFNHLRTYEDEHPSENEYHRPEYNFAAIENHSIFSDNRDLDRPYWKEPWTHHEACLVGYVPGKPVFMMEGNALWRRFWQKRTKATLDDFRQSAWACVTAGASFTWCGHAGEDSLVAFGPEGLPFFGDENVYSASADEIDILTDVMTKEVSFFTMTPSDSLLYKHNPKSVWCLSEPGEQYLVFSINGNPFKLELLDGLYTKNKWINTKTGDAKMIPNILVKKNKRVKFQPPNSLTDWVLLIRKK